MPVSIKFLGASGTVTGSKYLVRCGDRTILVDCGLFQGERSWREKNWQDPGFDLSKIDALLLTHAHIDHTGMLPRYYRLGLKCPIYCTQATHELSNIMLPDSGRLQEEEASYRSESGHSRHKPPLPLYTEREATDVLRLFCQAPFHKRVKIFDGVHAEWRHMGHILGAASITLEIGGRVINFSGDVGRFNDPLLCDPQPLRFGDLLLIESTYGDRLHAKEDTQLLLAEIVNRTVKRRGVVVIPAFAVGRAQQLLYHFHALKGKRSIPDLPVIVDSPMARDVTSIHSSHIDECSVGVRAELGSAASPFVMPKLHFTRDRQESIKLNSIDEPMVIISASGMLSGGRILHHLRHRISSPLNTILFVGYQPPGGRGAWIQSGAKSLTIFAEELPIRAEISELSALSAHADKDELLRWCRSCEGKPGRVVVVHGEPEQAQAFKGHLEDSFSWRVSVPGFLEEIEV